MTISNVRPMTVARPLVAKPAVKAPAQAAAVPTPVKTGNAGAVTGAVVGGGLMAGAYTAIRWFSGGVNPVMLAVAGAGVALAALGGSKLGAFLDRGLTFKDFTIGGAAGGALGLAAFGGGGAMLASFGAMSAPALLLMAAGAGLAALGGAAIGHAAQDKIVDLLKK